MMQISPAELSRLTESGAVKILDVRTREEFEAARIDGSVLFTQELMQEVLSRWNPEDALVIVDHKGARSMDAAAFFVGHGFSNARSLSGGIDAWSVEVDSSIPRYRLE